MSNIATLRNSLSNLRGRLAEQTETVMGYGVAGAVGFGNGYARARGLVPTNLMGLDTELAGAMVAGYLGMGRGKWAGMGYAAACSLLGIWGDRVGAKTGLGQ